jgi:hypothetical protein
VIEEMMRSNVKLILLDEDCRKRNVRKPREIRPQAVKDRRIQTVATDVPVDTIAPLQQIPPSSLHEEETMQQTEPAVVITPTTVAQEPDVMDIFLKKKM